ncbi:single-stranded DNA-binding protein [Paraflavitalea sp. CAU 1676]|uniref:single-stranded DNA-binding protein n=1 Tax=Paraflavitalea sp. CAU 1676 TaxID=3032598 RepID=UPI0023DAB0AE|nr:single-stranded DNA-binding protein [Paraflavitalea sp. CAU 1676]MDF2193432.1 single-stranded DNA-binding protein [Paraflavitalea sp. CAU 1676]
MHNNKVQLTGHLFGKPIIHKSKKGDTCVQCTVMLDSVHRNAACNQHLGTMAINVVAYDDVADMCEKHCKHRGAVVIEGMLSLYNTIGECGQNVAAIELPPPNSP